MVLELNNNYRPSKMKIANGRNEKFLVAHRWPTVYETC